MAHVGFLPVYAKGHMYPSSALALRLKERGHRVTFFCVADAAAFFQDYGLDSVIIGAKDFGLGYMEKTFARLGKLKGNAGVRYTGKVFEDLIEMHLAELPEAIKSQQVDAFVIDQFHMGGGTVADHLQIPYVHLALAMILLVDTSVPPMSVGWSNRTTPLALLRNKLMYALVGRAFLKPLCTKINRHRRAWGLMPYINYPNDAFANHPQMTQQPPSLEFPRRDLPRDFHFVGPLHNLKTRNKADFPWERLDGRPIIYASLGTLQNGLEWVFRTIIEAAEGTDAQLVLSLGGNLDPANFPGGKGNPVVVKWAPQLELLPKAELCITHAGLNTILESLANAVPMVAIPITNDQPGAAARVAWSGIGEVVPPKKLTATRLREAIQKVRTIPSYRENAMRLQKEIQDLNSLDYASSVIEGVLPNRA